MAFGTTVLFKVVSVVLLGSALLASLNSIKVTSLDGSVNDADNAISDVGRDTFVPIGLVDQGDQTQAQNEMRGLMVFNMLSASNCYLVNFVANQDRNQSGDQIRGQGNAGMIYFGGFEPLLETGFDGQCAGATGAGTSLRDSVPTIDISPTELVDSGNDMEGNYGKTNFNVSTTFSLDPRSQNQWSGLIGINTKFSDQNIFENFGDAITNAYDTLHPNNDGSGDSNLQSASIPDFWIGHRMSVMVPPKIDVSQAGMNDDGSNVNNGGGGSQSRPLDNRDIKLLGDEGDSVADGGNQIGLPGDEDEVFNQLEWPDRTFYAWRVRVYGAPFVMPQTVETTRGYWTNSDETVSVPGNPTRGNFGESGHCPLGTEWISNLGNPDDCGWTGSTAANTGGPYCTSSGDVVGCPSDQIKSQTCTNQQQGRAKCVLEDGGGSGTTMTPDWPEAGGNGELSTVGLFDRVLTKGKYFFCKGAEGHVQTNAQAIYNSGEATSNNPMKEDSVYPFVDVRGNPGEGTKCQEGGPQGFGNNEVDGYLNDGEFTASFSPDGSVLSTDISCNRYESATKEIKNEEVLSLGYVDGEEQFLKLGCGLKLQTDWDLNSGVHPDRDQAVDVYDTHDSIEYLPYYTPHAYHNCPGPEEFEQLEPDETVSGSYSTEIDKFDLDPGGSYASIEFTVSGNPDLEAAHRIQGKDSDASLSISSEDGMVLTRADGSTTTVEDIEYPEEGGDYRLKIEDVADQSYAWSFTRLSEDSDEPAEITFSLDQDTTLDDMGISLADEGASDDSLTVNSFVINAQLAECTG